MARGRRQPKSNPRYPRMARVNELVREIIADELELIEDERLGLVTITHVTVDPDLRRGAVDFSSLGENEEAAAEALAEHRWRLQSAIARQARLRHTPELRFRVDAVIEHAARIEELLAQEGRSDDDER
jgi:ribosome-binding factor A